MSAAICTHAPSGCNYPDGECVGLCMKGSEMSTITKEQRDKFINEYASRIVEMAGWTAEEAMNAALAEDVDERINEGFNGADAADEEMTNWADDGED